MENPNDSASEFSKLRQKAEKLLPPTSQVPQLSEADALKLVHELEVHQIELEMQNQELQLAILATNDAVNLYDFAPVGFFTLSQAGDIIRLNFNGALKLGKDRSSLINHNFKFFISKDTRPAFNLFLSNVFQSNGKESCEVSLWVDGADPMYVQLNGIATESGEHCLLTAIDITERKESVQTIIENEKRFRMLFENSMTGILLTHPDGAILTANPEACRLLGRTEADICRIGRDGIVDLTNPNLSVALEKRRQTGHFHGELTFKRGDGTVFPIDLESGFFTDSSGQKYAYNFFQDITERKLAEEEAVHESEEKYRKIFSIESDALFLIDQETGDIQDVNDSACQLYGYSRDEMLQRKNVDMSAEPEDTHLATIEMRNRIEIRYHQKKDGTVFPVDISANFLNLKGRQVILAAIRDISYRIETERILKQKNKELSEVIAEKDKFFSILAHDLRNPFNALLGFTQILAEDLPTMELDRIQQISSILRSSAFNAYSLLDNLLDWSRLKRGITSLDLETFVLIHKIEESLKSVNELATKKGIEISLNVAEDLVITADRNMLGSIIRNLISNAIKFTPEYGYILISDQVDREQSIEISVKDSGIGMNKEILDQLFNIGRPANRKGTEGESSTGLGLTICKEFVEKHGGRIWAESEEGKGSTFYFTIPQATKD